MNSPGAAIFNTVLIQAHDILLNRLYVPLGNQFQDLAGQITVLFITLVGLTILKGKGREYTTQLIVVLIALPVVTAISFSHDATLFRAWIYEPIIDTSLAITGYILSLGVGNGNQDLAGIFEVLDDGFLKIGSTMLSRLEIIDLWSYKFFPTLLAFGILLIGFGVLYALFLTMILVGYISIHILLVPASIMIFFGSLPITRHIFISWLKALLTFALIPIFAAITLAFTLSFISAAISDIGNMSASDSILNMRLGTAYLTIIIAAVLLKKAPEFASYITGGTMSSMGGVGAALASAGGAVGVVGASTANKLSGGMQGWSNPNLAAGGITGSRPYSAAIGLLKGKQ